MRSVILGFFTLSKNQKLMLLRNVKRFFCSNQARSDCLRAVNIWGRPGACHSVSIVTIRKDPKLPCLVFLV